MVMRTSGSTGTYLKVNWDRRNYVDSVMETWLLRKRYYGISPYDKRCDFYATVYEGNKLVVYPEGQQTIIEGNRISFNRNNLDEKRIEQIYKEIYEFDPKWLMLQPSHAVLLAQCIEKRNFPKIKNLSFIECNGEILFEEVRMYLKNIFGCPVGNLYGMTETSTIAYECPYEQMHVCESNVLVEILDDNGKSIENGKEGNVVVTTLTNYAMPFIRYFIGDRGSVEIEHSCKCGNKSKVLKLTKGRTNDYVIDRNGDKIHAFIFIRPIEFVNERIGHIIKQFQIIQNGIDDFTVNLSVNPQHLNWKEAISKLFINSLMQESLYGAKFSFNLQTELFPDSRTGKLAYFTRSF